MAMSEDDHDAAAALAETEIHELHEFFQGWYRGTLDADAFRRFEQVMGAGFEIVLPDAVVLDRRRILEACGVVTATSRTLPCGSVMCAWSTPAKNSSSPVIRNGSAAMARRPVAG